MFAKLSTLALALPLVSALTLNTPTGVTTGGTVTFTWTASTTDPAYFSLELVNTIFHNTYAIANNVQTSLGILTIEIPQLPTVDGYTVEAIATNNINQVLATSGDFAVGAATTPTSSMPSTTSSASTSMSMSMASGTTTASPVTATSPATVATHSTTASASASATPTSFNSGAASFKIASGVAPAAAMVLAAVAGAVMVF